MNLHADLAGTGNVCTVSGTTIQWKGTGTQCQCT